MLVAYINTVYPVRHTLIRLREKYFKKQFLNPPYINLEKRAALGYLSEVPIEELHF